MSPLMLHLFSVLFQWSCEAGLIVNGPVKGGFLGAGSPRGLLSEFSEESFLCVCVYACARTRTRVTYPSFAQG